MFKNMFKNIGGKIKGLATIVTVIGMICSVILFIVLIVIGDGEPEGFISGLLLGGLGCLSSWLGSFLLYGFGQLIESAENIEYKLNHTNVSEPEIVPNTCCNRCGAPTQNSDGICNSCRNVSMYADNASTVQKQVTPPVGATSDGYCKKCGNYLPNGIKFCSKCKTYNG